jgi:hypothetical protein
MWPSSLGFGRGANNSDLKTSCYEMLHRGSELAGSCENCNKPSVFINGGGFLD